MAKEQKAKQRTTEQKNPATKRRENPTPTATSQNKTKYMAASFTKYLPWINAFLFAAFAFYMLAVRNSDYLYAAQEHSLFLFDRSFYDMVMVKPGALMSYLGCFFTQFFYHPELGTSMLIAIWLTTYFLTIKAFRLNGWWSILALLPVAALLCSETILGYWFYYNKVQGYWFAPSIALLLNMLVIWLYRRYQQKNKWIVYGGIVVWCIIGYWNTGWLGLIATFIMAETDLLKDFKKRILPLSIAIVCIAGIPIIFYQFYTQMRIDDAWWVGIPIFATEAFDATRPWYPFISLVIILLTLGTITFGLDQKKIVRTSKVALGLIAMEIIGLTTIVFCELAADFNDENYHAEFRMYRAVDEQRWQDVLKEAAELKSSPTREIILLRNIALNYSGKTGSDQFRYNNISQSPYVYDSLAVHMAQTCGPLVYLHYARLNFATRWSIENSVEHGFSNNSYKILARCALASGEINLARKYLGNLKKTLYHKKWAERYDTLLVNPKDIASTPEFSYICEYYKHFSNTLDSDEGLVEIYLLNYFSSTMNKDSKLLQQTTLDFALQSKDIEKFWPRFFLYAHLHSGEPMPMHYQEAAFLYGSLENKVDISKMPFDPDRIVTRYASFNQQSNTLLSQGRTPEEIGQILKPTFGDTFWWFYFFCTGMESY